jgi:peroxiredoxin
MKKACLFACLVSLLLFSCGDSQKNFKIEGSFKGFKQGELYVYSMDGSRRLDTIGVSRGEFVFQTSITEPTTLVVVFPNYSELPVFAEPGVTIKVKGDASHLKETEIKGSDSNKAMTDFRLRTSNMMPPDVVKEAAKFINEQPASPVSIYLLYKYFIQTPEPDYAKIQDLLKTIIKAQPENQKIAKLSKQLEPYKAFAVGKRLPSFSAKGLNGESVSSSDLNAKVNVITLWASWNYESVNIQNLLARLKKQHEGSIKVLGISIDGSVKDCQKIVDRDSIKWSTVCDGKMWETPVLQKVGLTYLPDNVVIDGQGKIVARSLNYQELNKKIEELIE